MVARVYRMNNVRARGLIVVHGLNGASFPAAPFVISHYVKVSRFPPDPQLPIRQDVRASAHALQ